MTTKIIMPKLGMNMKEGTVVEWLRHEQEPVKKGDPIAVISSDKIEKEVETPEDGVLLKIKASENEVVPIGTTIGIVGAASESVEEEDVLKTEQVKKLESPIKNPQDWSSKKPTGNGKRVLISPSARKLAESLGIEVEKIQGTGPNGRITNEDIQIAAAGMVRPEAPPAETSMNIEKSTNAVTIKPLTGMRKTIADRLTGSLQTSAQLTITMKADLTELQAIRKTINLQSDQQPGGTKLTVTDFVAKATVLALQLFPNMNSALLENELHLYKEVHLGIAVSLENGLIVPVIRNAEKMSIGILSEAIRSLGQKARRNELGLSEISGATFSITNLGRTGVEYFTPVLNPPETGILGVGTATKLAVFGEDGTITGREFLPLSLTFDHSVTDGNPASEFLGKIKFYLENPLLMLI